MSTTDLAKHQPINWKELRKKLPHGYMSRVRALIDKPNLSDALISLVAGGEKPDHHGIRKAVLKILKEEQEAEKELLNEYKEITK